MYRRLAVAQCWVRDTAAAATFELVELRGFRWASLLNFSSMSLDYFVQARCQPLQITAKIKQQHSFPFLANHDQSGALRAHWYTHRAILLQLRSNILCFPFHQLMVLALLSRRTDPLVFRNYFLVSRRTLLVSVSEGSCPCSSSPRRVTFYFRI